MSDIECNFYDKEEIHPDCTVQVLTNTVTGEVSVGWKKNEWIDVRERVPQDFGYEDGVQVVCLLDTPKGLEPSVCIRNRYGWMMEQRFVNNSKVVAWRPLPEVPKEWRADNG